jgi:hypothetical protein
MSQPGDDCAMTGRPMSTAAGLIRNKPAAAIALAAASVADA